MSRSVRPRQDRLKPLAQAATSGEPASVRAFLTAVGPTVLRVVRQVLGPGHADVEDVTQEALIGTLDAISRFREQSSVVHYVRRVALLTALNARRRHQLREQLAPQVKWDDALHAAGHGLSPPEDIDHKRRLMCFESLLDELPASQAEVIALHCILGYTVAEVAQLCEVPENTVRSRLVTAKAALRKRLEADGALEALVRGVS